jgi:hypothetical protein
MDSFARLVLILFTEALFLLLLGFLTGNPVKVITYGVPISILFTIILYLVLMFPDFLLKWQITFSIFEKAMLIIFATIIYFIFLFLSWFSIVSIILLALAITLLAFIGFRLIKSPSNESFPK